MDKARLYELTDWLELSDLDWIGTGYYSQTWGIIVLVIVVSSNKTKELIHPEINDTQNGNIYTQVTVRDSK